VSNESEVKMVGSDLEAIHQATGVSRLTVAIVASKRTGEPVRLWDDVAAPNLAEMGSTILIEPVDGSKPRKAVAVFFAVRSLRRITSLSKLFGAGQSSEALPVVRSSYEDWLEAAYRFGGQGNGRALEFIKNVDKYDAKVLRAFRELAGVDATREVFGEPPEGVKKVLASGTSLRPTPTWLEKARIAGLGTVHEFAYTVLSGLSHGSFKNSIEMFSRLGDVSVARWQRDLISEFKWALWAYWFELRVMTLAGRELGHSLDGLSDEVLDIFGCCTTFENAVFVKERVL
jgi:hypothetical protein